MDEVFSLKIKDFKKYWKMEKINGNFREFCRSRRKGMNTPKISSNLTPMFCLFYKFGYPVDSDVGWLQELLVDASPRARCYTDGGPDGAAQTTRTGGADGSDGGRCGYRLHSGE